MIMKDNLKVEIMIQIAPNRMIYDPRPVINTPWSFSSNTVGNDSGIYHQIIQEQQIALGNRETNYYANV